MAYLLATLHTNHTTRVHFEKKGSRVFLLLPHTCLKWRSWSLNAKVKQGRWRSNANVFRIVPQTTYYPTSRSLMIYKKKMIVRGWNVNYHGTVNSNDFQQLLKSEQRLDGRIRNDDNSADWDIDFLKFCLFNFINNWLNGIFQGL